MKQVQNFSINIVLSNKSLSYLKQELIRLDVKIIIFVLGLVAVMTYFQYYQSGIGLAYNDARSHLDIGRRVVEGLEPGLAQLGSVWLPLPHLLMIPTIWNDFMWHSGLAGALQSMASFVATALLIYLFLRKLGVGMLGRLI